MLNESELAPGKNRIVVLLVRARNPNNIGAVARAMHDFGFSDLRIVNDYAMPLEGARSAVDASSILQNAGVFQTVGDAVADCSLVVGTTAVGERDLNHSLMALCDAAPKILSAIAGTNEGRVAILFGSEKTGLSNEELSHCNWLLTVPMHAHKDERHPSMNLGQAVAVCLYELVRGSLLTREPKPVEDASAAEMERLTVLLAEVANATEYKQHHPANSGLTDLRRLVLRLRLTQADLPVWMGILRQILWKLRA